MAMITMKRRFLIKKKTKQTKTKQGLSELSMQRNISCRRGEVRMANSGEQGSRRNQHCTGEVEDPA